MQRKAPIKTRIVIFCATPWAGAADDPIVPPQFLQHENISVTARVLLENLQQTATRAGIPGGKVYHSDFSCTFPTKDKTKKQLSFYVSDQFVSEDVLDDSRAIFQVCHGRSSYRDSGQPDDLNFAAFVYEFNDLSRSEFLDKFFSSPLELKKNLDHIYVVNMQRGKCEELDIADLFPTKKFFNSEKQILDGISAGYLTYKTKGRKTHLKEFKNLVKEINNSAEEEKEREAFSLEEIIKKIEEALLKAYKAYSKPFLGIGQRKSWGEYAAKVNKSKASFQYPKLLAEVLDKAYQANPELLTDERKESPMYKAVSAITQNQIEKDQKKESSKKS